MPNLMLCGHVKCGTNYISACLENSPTIDFLSPGAVRKMTRGDLEAEKRHIRAVFESASRPIFVHHNQGTHNTEWVDFVRELDPDIRAILIYRDPVDTLQSYQNRNRWTYRRPENASSYPFVDRFVRDIDLVEAVIHGPLNAFYEQELQYGRSARFLREKFRGFLELTYDEFQEDAHAVFEKMFTTMGAEPIYYPPQKNPNQGRAPKSWVMEKIIMKSFLMITGINSNELQKAFVENTIRPSPYYLLMKLNNKKKNWMSEKQKRSLREFVQPMIADFRSISDLDIGAWEYD